MARDAGAKKVYFASCAPPIRYPNVYGIDMPTRQELVAHGRNEQEVADKVIYQELDDLIQSVRRFNLAVEKFDTSVFDNCYVTGDVDEKYLAHLEGERNEESKGRLSIDSDCVGLYNNYQQSK
jgi:amidophosphoribosyltransferase